MADEAIDKIFTGEVSMRFILTQSDFRSIIFRMAVEEDRERQRERERERERRKDVFAISFI